MPPHEADPAAFARLRDMYKRYMLNPVVASWLLPRDAPSDYQVVRKEFAVQVCVTSASPPEVLPENVPEVSFPASDDLLFLEHNQAGFALGHIWGSMRTERHPYAALAARAGKKGWETVRSRKFACDLTVTDAMETVEYCWFTDNSVIIVLSRVPLTPEARKVRISEVLFFPPVPRPDIPPQRPELVLLVHDRARCAGCSKEICTCPNTLGVPRGTPAALAAKEAFKGPCGLSASRVKMPWEHRLRMLCHGEKRGLLTVVYSSNMARSSPRITVRQAYISTCANQDAIAYRIQQQLTSLLTRLPRADQSVRRAIAVDSNVAPTSAVQKHEDSTLPFGPDIGQSPLSFTPSPVLTPAIPRAATWVQPRKLNSEGVVQSPNAPGCNKGTPVCYPQLKPSLACKTAGPKVEEAKADQAVLNASAGSLLSTKSAPDSSSRETPAQSSLCGPEKAGTDCDCSAEKVQDPSLALILNSGCEQPIGTPMAEMSAFIEPIIEPSNAKNLGGQRVLEEPVPSMGPGAAIGLLREDEKGGMANLLSTVRFGSLSPDSGRLGGVTALPSPLPAPTILPEEPPWKRQRTDGIQKGDTFGLGLDPSWPSSFEDQHRGVQLPPWHAPTLPERPLSALSRALGAARSPSPLALISGMQKSPSPRNLMIPGPPVTFLKLLAQDNAFQGSFDANAAAMPSANDGAAVPKQEPKSNSNASSRTRAKVADRRDASPREGSRNTSEGIVTNGSDVSAGNGVCCEICGISFAKRSNKLRHVQTVHNRLKQFECDLCGTKFGLKADLRRHKFRIHESRAFCCETCGKSFAEQSQLELHIRVTHEEDSRPWECKKCRIRFGRKSSLTRHEQTVHQQTRFTCRICKKSYSQKFDAVRHERKVHGLNDKPNT